MSKTIHVSVTQEHIDKGVRFRCKKCPISLALQALLGPSSWTGNAYAYNKDQSFLLPWHVQNWILDFDHGDPVEPFEFDLELT